MQYNMLHITLARPHSTPEAAFAPVGVGSLHVKSPFSLACFPPSFPRRLKNHTEGIILRIVSYKGPLGVV